MNNHNDDKIIYSNEYLENFVKFRERFFNLFIGINTLVFLAAVGAFIGAIFFDSSEDKMQTITFFMIASIVGYYNLKFTVWGRDRAWHFPWLFVLPYSVIITPSIGMFVIKLFDWWNQVKVRQAQERGIF